ncbi:hypothetical protein PsorP6_002490 [Peronosclerospora sorghi]|uniref:Uncharacterized protein n=1 Tax=Peronosclerospora sorghi TaxID=230839 RepID=A0ACC0WT77_9STRA|nr:hypothetical protein PsorP6_002490 [Peronosclerospora sorghi]
MMLNTGTVPSASNFLCVEARKRADERQVKREKTSPQAIIYIYLFKKLQKKYYKLSFNKIINQLNLYYPNNNIKIFTKNNKYYIDGRCITIVFSNNVMSELFLRYPSKVSPLSAVARHPSRKPKWFGSSRRFLSGVDRLLLVTV